MSLHELKIPDWVFLDGYSHEGDLLLFSVILFLYNDIFSIFAKRHSQISVYTIRKILQKGV